MPNFSDLLVIYLLVTLPAFLFIGLAYLRSIKKRKSDKKSLNQKHNANLQSAQSQREQLLNALPDAIILVNSASQISFANDSARQLVKGRRLRGRSIIEAFIDDRLSVAIMKCIRTGKAMQETLLLKKSHSPLVSTHDDETSAWVIDVAPLSPSSPSSPEALQESQTRVVIRDISAQHQTEQIRQDFVANASHELRTPMAIINGYLENLLDDDALLLKENPQLTQKFLHTMQRHGSRIAQLVEDMLLISKIESHSELTITKAPFTLRDCLTDVHDRLSPLIIERNAQLELDLQPPELTLHGDRFYFTQIFFNLIENALKENSTKTGLRLLARARQTENHLLIEITDNGLGIPATDLPYIFKRFYRVAKHHNQEKIPGTGLGLSIVKRAIQAHQGTITATSTPNQATTFTIKLPHPTK